MKRWKVACQLKDTTSVGCKPVGKDDKDNSMLQQINVFEK